MEQQRPLRSVEKMRDTLASASEYSILAENSYELIRPIIQKGTVNSVDLMVNLRSKYDKLQDAITVLENKDLARVKESRTKSTVAVQSMFRQNPNYFPLLQNCTVEHDEDEIRKFLTLFEESLPNWSAVINLAEKHAIEDAENLAAESINNAVPMENEINQVCAKSKEKSTVSHRLLKSTQSFRNSAVVPSVPDMKNAIETNRKWAPIRTKNKENTSAKSSDVSADELSTTSEVSTDKSFNARNTPAQVVENSEFNDLIADEGRYLPNHNSKMSHGSVSVDKSCSSADVTWLEDCIVSSKSSDCDSLVEIPKKVENKEKPGKVNEDDVKKRIIKKTSDEAAERARECPSFPKPTSSKLANMFC